MSHAAGDHCRPCYIERQNAREKANFEGIQLPQKMLPTSSWWIVPADKFSAEAEKQYQDRMAKGDGVYHIPKFLTD